MKGTIQFLKFRYIAFAISFTLLVLFLAKTFIGGGFNMGIDFVGGTKIVGKFEKGIAEAQIRNALKGKNAMIQQIGAEDKHEFMISIKMQADEASSNKESELVKSLLTNNFTTVQFLSVENVGPAVGDFLRRSAWKLSLIAIVLMSVYLAFRFETKYAAGCMVALMHDVILTTCFCGFAGIEINIPIIAALLTIFGFSVNDTIVIFDRVRENLQFKSKQSFTETINLSITQTLSRTFITSLTVLFCVLALLVLGGEGLYDFSRTMVFGLFVGTYSTIYIASPVVVFWEKVLNR